MIFKRGTERGDIFKVYLVAGKLMSRQIIRGEEDKPLRLSPTFLDKRNKKRDMAGDNEMEKIKMPFRSLLFILC